MSLCLCVLSILLAAPVDPEDGSPCTDVPEADAGKHLYGLCVQTYMASARPDPGTACDVYVTEISGPDFPCIESLCRKENYMEEDVYGTEVPSRCGAVQYLDWIPDRALAFVEGYCPANDSHVPCAVIVWADRVGKPTTYSAADVSAYRWVVKNGRGAIGVYRQKTGDSGPSLELVDADTLAVQRAKLEDWAGVFSGERLRVGEKLTFDRTGLEQVEFPFMPPKALLGDAKVLEIIRNDAKRVVLWLADPVSKDQNTHILVFDKANSAWSDRKLMGDRSRPQMFGDAWLKGHVGWDYPEAGKYGPAFTNEWDCVNLETGASAGISSTCSDTDVLIREKNYSVDRENDNLVTTGQDSGMRCKYSAVLYNSWDARNIRLLFWGKPAE